MEIIEVFFETDPVGRDSIRILDASPQAPSLLLGREALYQNVNRSGHQQFLRALRVTDGIRLASSRLGPMHEATVEVTRINERHGADLRFTNEKLLGPKVHHSACRNFQTEFPERVREALKFVANS